MSGVDDDEELNGNIPKVALGPSPLANSPKPLDSRTLHPQTVESLSSLRKELDTQERIIVTLQRDNEALLREKKDILARYKELESNLEHLEAKHSLLLSAQQESGSRSSLRVANDAAKIAKLQAQVLELQGELESEKSKSAALSLQVSENRSHANPAHTEAAVSARTPERLVFSAEETVKSPPPSVTRDHATRLREYEHLHELHKATIDKLHVEVNRLESEKSELEGRYETCAHDMHSMVERVRQLEKQLDQKKESIGELLRSCQDSAANVQQVRKQEARIRALEAALSEKDDFTKKAMERLRDETKAVCARYQERIAELQQSLANTEESAELRRRLGVLEKENLELRRNAGSQNASGVSHSSPSQAVTQVAVSDVDEERKKASREQGDGASGSLPDGALQALQKALQDATAEATREKERAESLQQEIATLRAEWAEKLSSVRHGFALQLQTMRASHNDELSRLEAGHRAELEALSKHKVQSDADRFMGKLLSIAESRGYDATLVAICERLSCLEKRSLQKEEEMSYELAEVKRTAELEKRLLTERKDLQLEEKNLQIKSFRFQLDELLASITVLQASSHNC